MATYEDSPSFSFTTPEQRRQRYSDHVNDSTIEKWNFHDSPSPITAARFQGEEQDENKSQELQGQHWIFAHSHFRRRNRLETRLEELQKDVASLTLKLRTNGSRNTSLNTSSFLYPPKQQEETKIFKTPKTVDKRRKSAKEIVTGRGVQNSVVKARRELHDVTTERDQLKYDLERTKRALKGAEKKLEDAQKIKVAYEKLRAHCDSLQESLDLSEKIRGRQKKLLHQLQLQQQQFKDEETQDMTKRPAGGGFKTRDSSTIRVSTTTTPKRLQQTDRAQDYTCIKYNNLDSSIAFDHHRDDGDEDASLSNHEQAPSEPTAATIQARTPRPHIQSTTSTSKACRQNFDSLLRENTPHFSTRRPGQMITPSRQSSRSQSQQREVMRQAARWARNRGVAVDSFNSNTHLSTQEKLTASRPRSSFLAPTQASLRRLHDLPRRGHNVRPPFIV
ncbi:uncharacterized protein PHALS_04567 [Plasmopara halstedii]|uniref:Uncharacterized protein n=1 Tax=Plasmopara halstedii TaxID=4781 RepID=A0A0P1A8R7_PLAHL|nr:uncharacterized protein PHALS_04567 [Plasmopara halstedii]CEG37112.1 hypothetical protein PHALS_04567 [Plasmopara halstedii]|eukprot:XP_024573481.1 hypothetical protein PHALS_04567 [Plasmopara halstedii]